MLVTSHGDYGRQLGPSPWMDEGSEIFWSRFRPIMSDMRRTSLEDHRSQADRMPVANTHVGMGDRII